MKNICSRHLSEKETNTCEVSFLLKLQGREVRQGGPSRKHKRLSLLCVCVSDTVTVVPGGQPTPVYYQPTQAVACTTCVVPTDTKK